MKTQHEHISFVSAANLAKSKKGLTDNAVLFQTKTKVEKIELSCITRIRNAKKIAIQWSKKLSATG